MCKATDIIVSELIMEYVLLRMTTKILIKMTVCFSALALTLERRCIPQFLGGSSINVMVHPIPRHPALLLYGYYTCVEPRRLKVLTPDSVMVPMCGVSEKNYIYIYVYFFLNHSGWEP